MMAYYVSGMVYFYGISNYVIHMPISWKLVVINCFLITVVEDFLLCVMAAFLAKGSGRWQEICSRIRNWFQLKCYIINAGVKQLERI